MFMYSPTHAPHVHPLPAAPGHMHTWLCPLPSGCAGTRAHAACHVTAAQPAAPQLFGDVLLPMNRTCCPSRSLCGGNSTFSGFSTMRRRRRSTRQAPPAPLACSSQQKVTESRRRPAACRHWQQRAQWLSHQAHHPAAHRAPPAHVHARRAAITHPAAGTLPRARGCCAWPACCARTSSPSSPGSTPCGCWSRA